jgi:hypothetical protein
MEPEKSPNRGYPVGRDDRFRATAERPLFRPIATGPLPGGSMPGAERERLGVVESGHTSKAATGIVGRLPQAPIHCVWLLALWHLVGQCHRSSAPRVQSLPLFRSMTLPLKQASRVGTDEPSRCLGVLALRRGVKVHFSGGSCLRVGGNDSGCR